LTELLFKNGYQLVDDASKADLELQIKYSSVVKKRKNLGIFFFVPFFKSYNDQGVEVEATFITHKCSRNKKYRARYDFEISSAIASDLKQSENKQ